MRAGTVQIDRDGREPWVRQAGSGPMCGVGRSALGCDEASIEDFADDAYALPQALRIERADIVGSSMGGAIAQELALRAPEVVASLLGGFGADHGR